MLSYSRGVDKKSYVVTGQWDCNDPAFQPLNQETPKESCIFFSVAVDIVLKVLFMDKNNSLDLMVSLKKLIL